MRDGWGNNERRQETGDEERKIVIKTKKWRNSRSTNDRGDREREKECERHEETEEE